MYLIDTNVISEIRKIRFGSANKHVPNPKPLRDGLIAATALVHSMTVVTRNVDDFKMAGVKIFDPW